MWFLGGIDIRDRVAKDVVENVVDPCTPKEPFGGDVVPSMDVIKSQAN
jgi:hypothetical protein